MSSGRDPRHETLPRDTQDDVCKKVADLRMTPIEGREFQRFREEKMRGRVRMSKLEAEMDNLIASSLRYKSPYKRSAKQLANEAIEAAELESLNKGDYKRTTKIVETKRKV